MFSQKINARIDAVDKENLLAIALLGSYARGEAGKYSDIDILCLSEENGADQPPCIEIIDGKYVVISTVSSEEVLSWFSRPEKAVEYLGGLRTAKAIWDPQGYLCQLRRRAAELVWDESFQKKANLYAGRALLGWIEEVHKALQGVLTGDTGRMLNGLHGLTYGIFRVLRVQRGIFLSGENYFFEEVVQYFGQQSEFARLSRIAFGVESVGELAERVWAGLELFCLTADLLSEVLSDDVKEAVLFVVKEVTEEMKARHSHGQDGPLYSF